MVLRVSRRLGCSGSGCCAEPLDGDDEEWEGDKRLSHDDGHFGEGDVDSDNGEVLANESASPKGVEESDSTDDGWQDEGYKHEGTHDTDGVCGESCEEDCEGQANNDAEHGGDTCGS